MKRKYCVPDRYFKVLEIQSDIQLRLTALYVCMILLLIPAIISAFTLNKIFFTYLVLLTGYTICVTRLHVLSLYLCKKGSKRLFKYRDYT